MWHHIAYSDLGVDPAGGCWFITEPPGTPKGSVEKLAEIAFETFNVAALCIHPQAPLSLYASGRTTGVVLDCGETTTHAVPVWEGYTQRDAVQSLELGGEDVTKCLARLLWTDASSAGRSLTSSLDIVRQAKEYMCHIAADPAVEPSYTKLKSFELPDGNSLSVSGAAWQAPEILFDFTPKPGQPHGIAQLAINAVEACHPDMQQRLRGNVHLAGGTTTCPGFRNRLASELARLAGAGEYQVSQDPQRQAASTGHSVATESWHYLYGGTSSDRLNDAAGNGRLVQHLQSVRGAREDPTRAYSAWLGGSMIAAMPSARHMWVTRERYDEMGVGVVHVVDREYCD